MSNRETRHKPIVLNGRTLTIFDVVHAARDGHPVEIAPEAWEQVNRGRAHVERVLEEGGIAYGVNTGVGSQKEQRLGTGEIHSFNRRLLRAHATIATHSTISRQTTRAAVVCLLNTLVTGLSGVRPIIIERLLERLLRGELPELSAGMSVGASDLVPLSQLAAALFVDDPLELAAKEALSLMNSNAVSLGHGSLLLLAARKLLRGFDLSFSASLEGFRGNSAILDDMVILAHPQPGQRIATAHIRQLLEGSRLLAADTEARNLQDPLSFRCAPQIHGATYETLSWAWQNWEVELNAVVDNPVVDLEGGRLIAHGNMDTSLLAISMDSLRAALANAVTASAQRLHKLHWPAFSSLPSGLTDSASALGGVQFLNLSHIAEAQAAAARAKASPTLFTFQGQLADGVEDHAAMLPLSLVTTEELIDLAWVVQAIELTIAAWAIRRRGIGVDELGQGLRAVYTTIEPLLPIGREGGQVFDVRPIVDLVRDEVLVDLIDAESPPVPDFDPAPKTSVVPTD